MPKIDSSDGVSVRAMARRAISFEEMLAIFGFAAIMVEGQQSDDPGES